MSANMTAEAIAFTLRAEYAGTVLAKQDEDDPGTEVDRFLGGVIHVGEDGEELDVKAELEAGDGTIIVAPDADPRLVDRLDHFPALKRVNAPDGATVTVGGYEDRSAADLRGELTRRGLVGHAKTTKPDLVTALERIDAGERIVTDGAHIDTILNDEPVEGTAGDPATQEA